MASDDRWSYDSKFGVNEDELPPPPPPTATGGKEGWARLFGKPEYLNVTKANILARAGMGVKFPYCEYADVLRSGKRVTDLPYDEIVDPGEGFLDMADFLWGNLVEGARLRAGIGAPHHSSLGKYLDMLEFGEQTFGEVVDTMFADGLTDSEVALFTGGCPPDLVDDVIEAWEAEGGEAGGYDVDDEVPPPPPVPDSGMKLLSSAFGDVPDDFPPPPPGAPPGMDYLPPPPEAPPGIGAYGDLGDFDEEDLPPPPPRAEIGRAILTKAYES